MLQEVGFMNKVILLFFLLFFHAGDAAVEIGGPFRHSASAEGNSENHKFKDIVITEKDGQYTITGSCMVNKGVFYYSVEDGHRILIPETKVRVNNLYWTSFKLAISVPNKPVPENGALILNLYEKNRSKEICDQVPVVLEKNKD